MLAPPWVLLSNNQRLAFQLREADTSRIKPIWAITTFRVPQATT